jgi:polysaccharide biosynthesis transport protein
MERPNSLFGPNGNGQTGSSLSPDLLAIRGLQEAEGTDLPGLLAVLRRRWPVVFAVAATVLVCTAASTFSQKRIYQSRFQLLVEPVNADNKLSDLTKALSTVQGPSAKSDALDYLTQIQVLKSPALMSEVLKKLQVVYPSLTYKDLMDNMTITRPGETKILQVSYKDPDPVKIQTVLDMLSQAYLQYSLVERQTNLRQGIQFIDKQIPEFQGKFNRLQDEIQRFRQRYNFIDPESLASQLNAKTTHLDQQKQDLQQKAAYSTSYYGKLQDESGGIAVLKDAPVYQSLIQDLRTIEVQIAAESTRFKDGNITIQLLKQKRDNLLPILQDEAQRVLRSKLAEAGSEIELLRSSQQSLNRTEVELKRETENFATLSRRYTDMQRELQIANEALNRFIENQQVLEVKAAQTEIPWQVIEAPVKPTIPISPSVSRNLVLGGVAGLLLGVGAAMLLEKNDRVYRTIEDIKRDVRIPILGQLPVSQDLLGVSNARSSGWQGLFSQLWPASSSLSYGGYYGYGGASSFLEALRILYSNLQLLSSDQSIRTITVSSSMPGDGKSTVSTYLAQTAVAMGKRVLLVDTDLRRPQVHAKMNIANKQGLSDLITSDLESQTVLVESPQLPGLTILTAGTIPPDPTKLLSSQKMRRLMKGFETNYDLVIYDTPPLLGMADASLLAPYTDGLVLVMRMAQTDRAAVKQAMEQLRMSKIPVLGLVVNGVPKTATSGYSYYQYQQQQQKDLFSYLPEVEEVVGRK